MTPRLPINNFANNDWFSGKNGQLQLPSVRVEIAILDKPRSRLQKYRLTNLGKKVLANNKGQRL